MKYLLLVLIQFFASFIAVIWNRKIENKQDQKMYAALMIGGFIWSQLQTEYLILRINKHNDEAVRKV